MPLEIGPLAAGNCHWRTQLAFAAEVALFINVHSVEKDF